MNGFDEQDIVRALQDAGRNGPPTGEATAVALKGGRAAVRRRRAFSYATISAGGLALAVASTLAVQAMQAPTTELPIANGGGEAPNSCPTPLDEMTESDLASVDLPEPGQPSGPPDEEFAATIDRFRHFLGPLGTGWADVYANDPALTGLAVLDLNISAADGLPAGWGATGYWWIPDHGCMSVARGWEELPDAEVTIADPVEVTNASGEVVTIDHVVVENSGMIEHSLVATRIDSSQGSPLSIRASISVRNMTTGDYADAVPVTETDTESVTAWLDEFTDELVQAVSDS